MPILRWRTGPRGERPRRRRPMSRLTGCLLWVIALIVILIVLLLLFGGFQKGTKVGAARSAPASGSALASERQVSSGLPLNTPSSSR